MWPAMYSYNEYVPVNIKNHYPDGILVAIHDEYQPLHAFWLLLQWGKLYNVSVKAAWRLGQGNVALPRLYSIQIVTMPTFNKTRARPVMQQQNG